MQSCLSEKQSTVLFIKIFHLFALCSAFLFIVSCTKRQQPTQEDTLTESVTEEPSVNDRTFVFCAEGSPSSFNPQLETDGSTHNVTEHIYDRLFAFEYGTTKVISSLAEKWEVDEKGLEYTFDLRKGVKFHTTPYFTPTREFNADDVLFSFNRQRDPQHPYYKIGGLYKYFQAMDMQSLIKDIVKVNDHRVKFILSKPNAPFMANLAMGFAAILSKEYGDKLLEAKTPSKIDHEPIGTGPFVFEKYEKDTAVRLNAFGDYFSERGNIKKLIFAITPDANVRLQKLRANECQLIAYPAPADLEAIRRDTNLTLLEGPGLNIGYLAINIKKKPFDNKLVRQAIYHAFNREAYIQAVYLGSAVVAKNPIPPGVLGYHDEIKEYDYNIEKAKALLKKAGFPKGFKTDLWTLPVARPYIPSGKKLGEMMQADLARVGIQANIVTYDWPTYINKVAEGEHSLAQTGWTGDNGDPDNFLYTLLSCAAVTAQSNTSFWCHKPFDDLVTKAQQSNDIDERIRLYKEAQVIFKEEVPWILIAHSKVYRALRKNISNYKLTPIDRDLLTFVEMK